MPKNNKQENKEVCSICQFEEGHSQECSKYKPVDWCIECLHSKIACVCEIPLDNEEIYVEHNLATPQNSEWGDKLKTEFIDLCLEDLRKSKITYTPTGEEEFKRDMTDIANWWLSKISKEKQLTREGVVNEVEKEIENLGNVSWGDGEYLLKDDILLIIKKLK